MADFIVREARPEDVEAIADITYRGWDGVTIGEALEKRHGKLGDRTWRERKRDEIVAQFERRPQEFFVAELDGRVVGYASYWYEEERRLGHVGNNCVDPDFRGRGIGTALIGRVLERLRELGARVAMVTTLEHDLPARRVYEKHGFKLLLKSVFYSMDL